MHFPPPVGPELPVERMKGKREDEAFLRLPWRTSVREGHPWARIDKSARMQRREEDQSDE
jgi:hypothetical protein